MTHTLHRSPLLFLLPLALVYGVALLLVPSLSQVSDPGILAIGLTVDLVILVPLLYWLMVVRGRSVPGVTVVPVALLSALAASAILPAEHHATLDVALTLLPIAELAIVGYVGMKLFRIVRLGRDAAARGGDFYDRLRERLGEAIAAPTPRALVATEIALLYYLFSRGGADRTVEGRSFGYRKKSGYTAIFVAILMAAVTELVALHFLLASWSEVAAFVHLGISGYALLWIVGDYRALGRRPHVLTEETLRLRCGLRWDVVLHADQIATIRPDRRPAPGDDYLSIAPAGTPTHLVELREPIEVQGFYGMTRRVARIGVAVNDARGFEATMEEWLERSEEV